MVLILWSVSIILVLVTLLYFLIKNHYDYWKVRNVMQLEPLKFPFGNFKNVGIKFHISSFLKQIYDQYKTVTPVMGIFIWFRPTVILYDLEVIKDVLVKNFNHFHDRGAYCNAKTDPLSGHLFSLEGNEWRNMRTKLTPTFTSGKMKMMFNIVVEISNEMVKFLKKTCENDREIEMKDILSRFTSDVIGNVAFGLNINSMENPDSEFREIGRKFFKPSGLQLMKMVFIGAFPKLAKKFDMILTPAEVSAFFLKSIKETVEHREKNMIERSDFLNLLINLKNHEISHPNNSDKMDKLTFNELAAQCFLFFLAGFETSSTTMTFCLYELAQNPEIQSKLREEIKDNLEENEGQLNYESVMNLKYLQMVIDETLRKFPPLDILMRECSQDYQVPKTNAIIPKGVLTLIPTYAIHHDSDLYPDPEKFDPERFTEENKNGRPAGSYLPFGEGPRHCLGLRFGLMQTKIGIARLLTTFKFSVGPKTTIPMEFKPMGQVLTPINDMWLMVEKI